MIPNLTALPPAGPALPPVSPAALPPEVRADGPEGRKHYQAALGFERELLGHLTRSMMAAAKASGEQSESSRTSAEMMADTLASQVAQNGGMGLAASLYDALAAQERGR